MTPRQIDARIEEGSLLGSEAARLLASPQARRKRARIERERFTEEDGRAMYERVPSATKPTFDDDGEIVPTAEHDGSRAWTDEAITGASTSAEGLASFILSAGPQTPEAIARRAAVAASLLGVISIERAASIAKCHPVSISRLRKNAKRFFASKPA